MKSDVYREKLIEWVLQLGDMDSPTDSQFSAVQVADIIMKFNRDQKSGKVKF